MQRLSLREFVRFTLSEAKEDEEQLKRWYQSPKNEGGWFEDILFKKGIVPIQTPRGDTAKTTSVLGSGEYSKAFEVLYKGKHAVAKVTYRKDDVDIVMRLDELRSKLPENIAKHILKVYESFIVTEDINDLNDVGLGGGDDDGELKYVVIVEYLTPLPMSIRREYWGYVDDKTDIDKQRVRAQHLFDNPEEVAEIFEDVINQSSWALKFLTKKAVLAIKKKISEENLQRFIDDGFSIKEPQFVYFIRKTFEEVNKGGKMFKQRYISPELMTMFIKENFIKVLKKVIEGSKFPRWHGDTPGVIASKRIEDKRVSDLTKALKYIKEKFGISWEDLHGNNVMVRPSTGDFVISDPGLFEIK